MDKEVVTELIQADLNEENLKTELHKLLDESSSRKELKDEYGKLWHLLGDSHASSRAAAEIIALVSDQPDDHNNNGNKEHEQ